MTAAGDERAWVGRASDLLDRAGVDAVHVAVLHVTALALAARLYDLGGRVAHWDEARVAYWTVEFLRTGNVEYRPIIHGPFYHHVNRVVFELLGPTDANMRLVVAVVGGLFPLVALLLRDRLGDAATVALAVLLAVNPVLLYYSRFMRGDPLVAMFMFAAFACFVRAVDTRHRRWIHAGVVLVALGFTVKENALLYLVCWVGAGALLADYRFVRADERALSWPADAYAAVRRGWRLARGHWHTLAALVAEFLAVIVFFYAPRARTADGPGLWTTLSDPGVAPTVLGAATVGAWQDFWGLWINGGHQDHAYIPFAVDFLTTMAYGALALSLFAVVGFLADRYGGDVPSDLVSFCAYWGVASVVGYPLVTDIKAPWATVNAVVPLAVPAAVGVALVARWGYRGYARSDHLSLGVAAFVLLAASGQVAGAAVGATYLHPQSNENGLVQYAQPADDVGPVMDLLAAEAAGHEGPDVLLYGKYLVDGDASAERRPACAKWFNALPLPWYFAVADAEVTCAENETDAGATIAESSPVLVVVTDDQDDDLVGHLGDYERRTHRIRAWGADTAFYVHEDSARALAPAADE